VIVVLRRGGDWSDLSCPYAEWPWLSLASRALRALGLAPLRGHGIRADRVVAQVWPPCCFVAFASCIRFLASMRCGSTVMPHAEVLRLGPLTGVCNLCDAFF